MEMGCVNSSYWLLAAFQSRLNMTTTTARTVSASSILFCLVCTALFVAGCTDAPETPTVSGTAVTQPPERSDSLNPEAQRSQVGAYRDAVESVSQMNWRIREALAAGDQEAAHGPIHEIGGVLTELGKLAEAADLSDEQLRSVRDAIEQLSDSFRAVDDRMHGKAGLQYRDVAARIADSLLSLEDSCPVEVAVAGE